MVAAQFTGAGVCSTESVFLFLVLRGMLPTTKAELGGSWRGERPSAVMDTTAPDASGALPSIL